MPGAILHYCIRPLLLPAIVRVTQQPVLVHLPELLSGVGLVLLRRALNNKHCTKQDSRSQTHSSGIK